MKIIIEPTFLNCNSPLTKCLLSSSVKFLNVSEVEIDTWWIPTFVIMGFKLKWDTAVNLCLK